MKNIDNNSQVNDLKESMSAPASMQELPSSELLELGNIDSVLATSYGNTYDGLYTTRSWYCYR